MLDSAIGKIICAGAFPVPVFKVAYENIAIRKEKGTMAATLPIVEIADIAVTKMFGFPPIDIDRRSLQRAFIIATEIDVAGLVEITAQLVEGIVREIPSVDVAAKFAGWSRLIYADAIMPHPVSVGGTGCFGKGWRCRACAQDKHGYQRPHRY